jgi:YesN/AraC family two-component response regulator
MSLWLSKILHQFTDLVFASKDIEYGTIIAQAIRYIRKHYQERLTLEDTASAVALSPNYFSRIFNATMHISFSSYVNRLRVEQAQRLLLNTRLSLVEIAGIVGFEDQSYFSKVFKSFTTVSPGQYRKRAGSFPSDRQEIHSQAGGTH